MTRRVVFVAASLMLTLSSVHAGSADNEDFSCASAHDGGCVPAISASLLQKATRQDVKSTFAQEQPEAPAIVNCTGTMAQGRCWHLSELGETCIATCSKRGRSFSYTIASAEEPVTPKLVHHEPRTKQDPWGALECYVPSEDRYHPANENAARHFVGDIGNWSQPNCKLACPCGGSDSDRCSWKQPSACAAKFMWKGVEYSGCSSLDTEHEQPWCQHNYQHTEKDSEDWSYCTYSCEPEEPLSPKPPAPEPEEPPSPKPPAPKRDQVCNWQPNPECQEAFQYKGVEYIGCTAQDHPNPWCSRDRVHKGSFEECTWVCRNETAPGPEKPEEPEDPEEPEQPEQPEVPETCDRHPEPEKDFIGNSVTLDQVGYTIVTHVPSADSPMNMKRFVCRIVDEIGCRVNNSEALMAFVPLPHGDTYGVLKDELESLCNAGDGWAVPNYGEKNAVQAALALVKVAQALDGVKEA